LRRKGGKFENYSMQQKSQGIGLTYKRTLTKYNKALRQAKRKSWRRHCEEIEKVPECARLHRILSKDEHSTIGSHLKTETTPQQRRRPWKNYSGSTSLVQKKSWNHLVVGTVWKWSFRNGKDPGGTVRCPEGSLVIIN
jgi:hypothetical protein